MIRLKITMRVITVRFPGPAETVPTARKIVIRKAASIMKALSVTVMVAVAAQLDWKVEKHVNETFQEKPFSW